MEERVGPQREREREWGGGFPRQIEPSKDKSMGTHTHLFFLYWLFRLICAHTHTHT